MIIINQYIAILDNKPFVPSIKFRVLKKIKKQQNVKNKPKFPKFNILSIEGNLIS